MTEVLTPGRLDSMDVLGAVAGLPEQVRDAARAAQGLDGLPSHDVVDNVVVLGVGASGVAGDVLAAIGGPFVPVPMVVTKGYAPASFVGPGTLCFALSYSGDTEEVVEAASAAAAAGAHLVVVTSGGVLAEQAPRWGAVHVPVPEGIPVGRAALGALAVPPLVALESLGLFPGASGWVDAAVAQLTARRDQLLGAATDTPARRIARAIGPTWPLVVGAGPLGAVAARRWKSQVNLNAKAPAFASAIPDLCHDEIAGWGQHGDVTRQLVTLVELRHDEEHPQEARRFDQIRDDLAEVTHDVVEVRAEGEGPLAQLLDLVLVGDVVALHLAEQAGIDPGPVPATDPFRLS
ncbi:MAG TPA: SIS domain-containing protein [Acidimicrobiales bacterium]